MISIGLIHILVGNKIDGNGKLENLPKKRGAFT